MPDKPKRESKPRVRGMKSTSGVKEKIEKMPNGKDARKGYEAFLEKFGLKKEKWRGFRATTKRKTGEQ